DDQNAAVGRSSTDESADEEAASASAAGDPFSVIPSESEKRASEKEIKEYLNDSLNVRADKVEVIMNAGSEAAELLGFVGESDTDESPAEADSTASTENAENAESIENAGSLENTAEDADTELQYFAGRETAEHDDVEPDADIINEAVEEAVSSLPEDEIQDLTIVYIEKKGMTTRQLLTKLLSDPRVVSAEPDYKYELDENGIFGTEAADNTEAAANTEAAGTYEDEEDDLPEAAGGDTATSSMDDIMDLTDLQWGFNHRGNAEKYMSMYYGTVVHQGADIGIPYWNNSAAAAEADDLSAEWMDSNGGIKAANADGYVAVMDTGIDVGHPDLENVMADLSGYTTTAASGGGQYGINTVVGATDKQDVSDHVSHGTHVAGIIAAEWNGRGTSGGASGVKLIAVKACEKGGGFGSKAILDGVNYLIRLQKEMLSKGEKGIRALNCSFGGANISLIQALAMYNLGKTGIVICQSSGNDGYNVDKVMRTSSALNRNPYAVVVDNDDVRGRRTPSSNYGYTTDLFSPGRDILSTVPRNYSGTVYLPEADKYRSAYETFTDYDYYGAKYKGTKAFSEPFSKPEKIGRILTDKGFDNGGGCLEVELSELEEKDNALVLYLSVPIEVGAQPSYISFRNYRSFSTSQYRGTVNVGLRDLGSSKNSVVWSTDETLKDIVNIDTADVIQKTETRYKKNYEVKTNTGHLYLRIKLKPVGSAAAGDKRMRFDNIGSGSTLTPYGYKSGTSMATPSATGAAAVMYTRMENAGALSPVNVNVGEAGTYDLSAAARNAAAVAAALRASTMIPPAGRASDPNKEAKLWEMCSSGGQLYMAAGIQLTPLMEAAEVTAVNTANTASNTASGTANTENYAEGSQAGASLYSSKAYTVTITGRNFGSDASKVSLYVTDASDPNNGQRKVTGLTVSDTSISFDATGLIVEGHIVPGLTEFEVYAPGGMSCNVLELKFDNGSKGIFEKEYSLP
ncbi:MAG: S8 family serine peptidase, partial [Clostridiales bacterium]|nr:S8 family serine peptidase [Clostridiales bacterium]